MYTKKLLSVATAVAIMSVGAMAFDMEKDGTIISSHDTSGSFTEGNYSIEVNKSASNQKARVLASYVGGVEADAPMVLSPDDRGDALIYPAFNSGDGWETKITLRNTKDVAIIAKAVLYDRNDSHEIKDFNIYLSPYDVASFKIKGDTITTRDGSIAAGIDPRLRTDKVVFVKHEDPANTQGITGMEIDADGDFVITHFNNADKDVTAGYVVVYAMTQAVDQDDYHGNHVALYKDYRKLLNICRDVDGDANNRSPWIDIFTNSGGTAVNGTATGIAIKAPNVSDTCIADAVAANGEYNTEVSTMLSDFTTPANNALFGEVSMTHKGDNRSLLLKAKVIDNYTTDNQMMLWAPGEYASIQDRRLVDSGTAVANGYVLTKYNTDGILDDAQDMIVKHTYYTFNKKNSEKDASTLLLTQPMKRALVMAGHGDKYWTGFDTYKWGQFSLDFLFFDENENIDVIATTLQTVTSPVDSEDEKLYQPELATLDHATIAKGVNNGEGVGNEIFKNPDVSGYVDVEVNSVKGGLPAIVTEMISEDVGGEAQINWIYSAVSDQ